MKTFSWLPDGIPFSKRLFDLFLVGPVLVIFSPVLGLVALLILVIEGRPIFFRQSRPGYHCQIIRLIKFRTMRELRNPEGCLLPDSQRLSRLGRFLRATSLDEFPELINVLKGEMSLVGTRPLLLEYLPLYTQEQARRHEVRPGITGWAQVNGRNAISWEEKFKLDVWYVDNQSLWLDIRILWMTFIKVFRREGISQEGQATMEKFRGCKS